MGEPITGPWPVEDAVYFADCNHVSNSMLKVFASSIPAYHQRFVTRTMPAPKPSAEMQLGTLLHARLLEPQRWNDRVRKITVDGRTKAGKEYNRHMHDLADLDPGRLFVTGDDENTVNDMHAAVMAKPEAADALRLPGVHEGAIRWFHQETGVCVACKAKLDKVCDNGLILDLKTATDVANFPWAAHKYSYERQAAHYLEGAWEALGMEGPFLFVVVGSQPPHEVRTMVLGEEELTLGRRQNARLLAELAECHKTGVWQSRFRGIEVIRFRNYQMED